jgi:hypothetical protein
MVIVMMMANDNKDSDDDSDSVMGLHYEAGILSDRNIRPSPPSRPCCHTQSTLPLILSTSLADIFIPAHKALCHLLP